MNTLTPNRILQKGDEFKSATGNWEKVPAKDFGIQVMFSKYSQVRRPSEPEHKPISPAPAVSPSRAAKAELPQVSAGKGEPISPDSGESVKTAPVAKAEGDKVARPVVARGPGERPSPTQTLIEAVNEANRRAIAAGRFPSGLGMTVVPPTETEKAIEKAKRIGAVNGVPLELPFPIAKVKPSWTGRNGTFLGYGLHMHRIGDMIAISPVGKRGPGNCLIEFPAACIPQIIDWLTNNTVTKGTK